VVASFHDVTEGREAREVLRQLSRRLLTAQDEERRRISRDLHDDLAQILTAVKMSLTALHPGMAPAEFEVSVRGALEIVDETIRRARDLSLQLHPPMLEVLGLAPTVRWFVEERLRGAPLESHLSIDVARARHPPLVENACFRVLQEALTNVIRHSRAGETWIELREEADGLVMSVRDDGCGFESAATRARVLSVGSAGLAGMQERVAAAGGVFELRTEPGRGTRISVRFPLPPRS
jgi:two-component system sensor histidine kinase UhpB